jgi:hypothetical protein
MQGLVLVWFLSKDSFISNMAFGGRYVVWTSHVKQLQVCQCVDCCNRHSRRNFTETWVCPRTGEFVKERENSVAACLSAKLVPTFSGRWCHVFSMTDSYGRILGFLDRSRYFFFQVAPQLYSRSWVDPVPDPLLLRKYGSAGNRTRTSGGFLIGYDLTD